MASRLLPPLYLLFRRSQVDHPGLAQVRISGSGCVQIDDLSGPSLIRDNLLAHGWLLLLLAAVVVSICWKMGQIETVVFGICMPVLLLFTSVAWVGCRRIRYRLREIRDGSIIDIHLAYNPFTPWNQISSFALDPSAGDAYRLRVTKGFAFPIDAEIRLSEEQAQSLRRILKSFIAGRSRS